MESHWVGTSSRRIPRGKGYDKASIKKHIKAFESFDGDLQKYCRAKRLSLDAFALVCEKHFADWWYKYLKESGLEGISCAYCGEKFFRTNTLQTFCSKKCSADSRRDRDYFGGNRRSGIGIAEGVCQLCFKQARKGIHAHHTYGKRKDPENEYLIALCSGCHQVLEKLAIRNFADDPKAWERLIELVWLKRHGDKNSDMNLVSNVEFKISS